MLSERNAKPRGKYYLKSQFNPRRWCNHSKGTQIGIWRRTWAPSSERSGLGCFLWWPTEQLCLSLCARCSARDQTGSGHRFRQRYITQQTHHQIWILKKNHNLAPAAAFDLELNFIQHQPYLWRTSCRWAVTRNMKNWLTFEAWRHFKNMSQVI